MEKWILIDGFENYQISNFGRVRSIKSGNILKGGKDRNGYKCVNLRANGKTFFRPIHRLVALNHLQPIEGKNCVNHIDLNKENNHVLNLEFCNHYENNSHMKMNGSTSSKFPGVSYSKDRNKFVASIKVNGKHKFLGRFKTEIEAKNAYLEALKTYNIVNKYASNNSI